MEQHSPPPPSGAPAATNAEDAEMNDSVGDAAMEVFLEAPETPQTPLRKGPISVTDSATPTPVHRVQSGNKVWKDLHWNDKTDLVWNSQGYKDRVEASMSGITAKAKETMGAGTTEAEAADAQLYNDYTGLTPSASDAEAFDKAVSMGFYKAPKPMTAKKAKTVRNEPESPTGQLVTACLRHLGVSLDIESHHHQHQPRHACKFAHSHTVATPTP